MGMIHFLGFLMQIFILYKFFLFLGFLMLSVCFIDMIIIQYILFTLMSSSITKYLPFHFKSMRKTNFNKKTCNKVIIQFNIFCLIIDIVFVESVCCLVWPPFQFDSFQWGDFTLRCF